MTRMRYVKMDRIMNHMLIHALREVFRQEKEQGLPVDTTRDLVLKLAEQEEGKLYLTEAEHSKSVEALNPDTAHTVEGEDEERMWYKYTEI